MNRTSLYLAVILGVLFVIVGVVYATHGADTLPAYLPGHDATMTAHHTKHAIASFALAIASFVYAWFKSAPAKEVK